MSTIFEIQYPIDAHAELWARGLEPSIIDGKLAFSAPLPADLIPYVKRFKDDLIAILSIVDGAPIKGSCILRRQNGDRITITQA